MATKQIPALPALAEAPADDDRFAIRDTSSGSDKSLRVDRLLERITNALNTSDAGTGFGQIMGAVGQGAIVDIIENTNGTAIRWESGIQICLIRRNLTSVTANRISNFVAFPAPFFSTPVYTQVLLNDAGSVTSWNNMTPGIDAVIGPFARVDAENVNETFIFVSRVAGAADFAAGDTASIDVFLFGFWK